MSELAGNGCQIIVPFDERKPLKEIEKSILKKYRKYTWSKFIKAIKDYKLVEEGDKIAVAISGGKDSLLMAKMFQELKKHGQVKNISKKSFVFIGLSGIATGASWICYYKALHDGLASIVVPIDKLSILVTVAFAYIFLREKLSRSSMVGLILITVGTLSLLIKM